MSTTLAIASSAAQVPTELRTVDLVAVLGDEVDAPPLVHALARLVWTFLSRSIGEQSGWRQSCYWVCRLASSLARTPHKRPGQPEPLPPFDPTLPTRWPATDWRLRHRGIHPRDLDAIWEDAVALDGVEALLPLDLVVEVYPRAIWPAIAAVLLWGPSESHERGDRLFRLAARGNAPGYTGKKLTAATLAGYRAAFKLIWKTAKTLADSGYPLLLGADDEQLLAAWSADPRPLSVPRTAVRVRRERAAPTTEVSRQMLADLAAANTAASSNRAAWWNSLRNLRDESLLELFYLTAGRLESVLELRPCDLDWEHLCPWDGVRRPAICLRDLKGQRYETSWKVVPTDVAGRISRLTSYLGLEADSDVHLFFGRWRYYDLETGDTVKYSYAVDQQAKRGIGYGRRPGPQLTDQGARERIKRLFARAGYKEVVTPHLLRHFAQRTAEAAAGDSERLAHYLAQHPNPPKQINGQLIARLLLDHSMTELAHVYGDLATPAAREEWSAFAISAIHDILRGDAGAAKGLDVPRIVEAKRQYQIVRADLLGCEDAIDEHRAILTALADGNHPDARELETLRKRRLSLVQSARKKLSRRSFEQLFFEQAEIDHRIDDVSARLEQERQQASNELEIQMDQKGRIRECLARAQQQLEEATQARVPLPDGSAPADVDAQLRELLDGVEPQEPELDLPAAPRRRRIHLREWAQVKGVGYSTLRKQVAAALRSPSGFAYPLGNRRNLWSQPIHTILRVDGPNSRWFDYDALDLDTLRKDEIETLHSLLTQPY